MTVRLLWLMLGLTSVGAGVVGAILPLLPTTPFLLLAAFAFARSSPRLHAGLLAHPHFGPMIDDWRRFGAINHRAKTASVVVMALTFAFSAYLGIDSSLLVAQGAVLGAATLFVLTRPAGSSCRRGRRP